MKQLCSISRCCSADARQLCAGPQRRAGGGALRAGERHRQRALFLPVGCRRQRPQPFVARGSRYARRNGRRTVWFDAQTKTIDAATMRCAQWMTCICSVPKRRLPCLTCITGSAAATARCLRAAMRRPRNSCCAPDLVTRLAAGLVYQLHGLDDEEKSAALRRHADAPACGSRRRSLLTCCATRGATCRRCSRSSMRSTAIRWKRSARSPCRCCGSCSKPPQKQVEIAADERR